MNKETFAKYISNPTLLDNDTLPEIKAMLDEFPYFQSAWVLYIKNLHSIKDIRYESKLKTACAYISDRKHLHDILKGNYSIVQTQFIASQPDENISQQEEIPEEPATVQTQNLASQSEEIPKENPIVQTQFIASQPAENISQQEEIPEDTAIVQTQFIASQPEAPTEENAIVQTQNLASQQEAPTEGNATVQTQFIASQREIQDTESSNLQPLARRSQIFESSNPEPQELETQKPETRKLEPESSNLQPLARRSQIFESSNPESQELETRNIETQKQETISPIDQTQIRELIEKQLHSLGITANITFSGNSANIQFENLATDEKPEENPTEQPIVENEPPTEIHQTPTIEEQIEKRKNDRNKKANLIDKFIESKARIVPKKDYHSDNKLSTESIIEDEELFTEQLAKIYIKQGHLEKALETYEKLYLKYPEKNIYFATRIEYVKRLMNK